MRDESLPELDRELAKHINPERSRHFSPEAMLEFRRTFKRLEGRLLPEVVPSCAIISIVGSNGKGSTAFLLSRILKGIQSFAPVGLYTSPHLLQVTERIRLNESPVEAQIILKLMEEMNNMSDGLWASLSYFEVLTLVAMRLFRLRACPVQIFEAGLGGRFDATRHCRAQTTILTSITMEHAHILGNTPEAILDEKLGIITDRSRLLLCMPQENLDEKTIIAAARNFNHEIEIKFFPEKANFQKESYLSYNARFVVFCLKQMQTHSRLRSDTSFSKTVEMNQLIKKVPGRLQISRFQSTHSAIVFDTAHNSPALEILLDNIASEADFPGYDHCIVLFGTLSDRDPEELQGIFKRRGIHQIFHISTPDVHGPKSAVHINIENLLDKIRSAQNQKRPQYVIVTGSHRMYVHYTNILSALRINE